MTPANDNPTATAAIDDLIDRASADATRLLDFAYEQRLNPVSAPAALTMCIISVMENFSTPPHRLRLGPGEFEAIRGTTLVLLRHAIAQIEALK